MKKTIGDRLAIAAFLISLVVISVAYGTVAVWLGWFPAPQIDRAYRAVLDISENWKNGLALEPTRHLVAPDDSGRAPNPDRGYVRQPGANPEPGKIFSSNLFFSSDVALRLLPPQGASTVSFLFSF